MAARLVWDQVHAGSIPVTPTAAGLCPQSTALPTPVAQVLMAAHLSSKQKDWVHIPGAAPCPLRRCGAALVRASGSVSTPTEAPRW